MLDSKSPMQTIDFSIGFAKDRQSRLIYPYRQLRITQLSTKVPVIPSD